MIIIDKHLELSYNEKLNEAFYIYLVLFNSVKEKICNV